MFVEGNLKLVLLNWVCAAKFCSIGLFGKLQQLMQSEKERDMDFLKKLQTGSNANGKACDLFFYYPL